MRPPYEALTWIEWLLVGSEIQLEITADGRIIPGSLSLLPSDEVRASVARNVTPTDSCTTECGLVEL